MKNKKVIAVVLAITVLVCALTACSAKTPEVSNQHLVTQTTTELTTDTTSFKLSYSQTDSLNPFESETLNNQILQNLVFDSLFTLDESLDAQPSIATGYNYTDSKTLNVTIQSGIKFSDSSALTASDVAYSFNQAKSSPHWKNALKAISSATVVSETSVNFNLSYANPNAHKLLTFAIAKSTTDKKGYPIGSGKYKFGESDGKVYVKVNKQYPDFSPHLTKIQLVNVTSDESIKNAVNIGNISYAYLDLSNTNNVKIQSNKKAVNLNNLVYIGVNAYVGITSNNYIRRAISLAVDRETLTKSAYQGYAKVATSVFNPSSKLGRQTKVFTSTVDTSAAKQAILQSGYSENDLSITILTNTNTNRVTCAKLIKQQLEAVGFKVKISKVNNKTYQKLVKKRNFDIYIGETKIPNDMSLKSFFTKGGSTSYGIDLKNSKTKDSYNDYLNGDSEIGSFVLDFSEEMPFIPLLYRQGLICYSKSMHGDMQGYADNYFSNIEDWYFN